MWAWPTMGSFASLAVAGEANENAEASAAASAAVERARSWLETVEAALSPHRSDSDLCRWRRGALDLVDAAPLLREVIDDVAELTRVTQGGFNPTDRHGRYDPSGYVKGWAVRRAVDVLAEDGLTDVCLGVGGDLQMIGSAGEAQPWRAAVVDPADDHRILTIVGQPAPGAPLAIATSGSAQRGEHIWAALGMRRTHPNSNRDALASVTVVGPDLGRVDAFATAIWALAQDRNLDEAWDWLPGTGCAALAVTNRGRAHATAGMNQHLVPPAV